MELRYRFDPKKFYLGTLCKQGHCWPGTNQSLRRNYVDKRGRIASPCVGCTGRKQSDWLLSFVDSEAMGFPPGFHLGKLCKGEHHYEGREMTLRGPDGKCPKCETERRLIPKHQATAKRWRDRNRNIINQKAREKNAQRRSDPALLLVDRERQRLARARSRARHGRLSRGKDTFGLRMPCIPGIGNGGNARTIHCLMQRGMNLEEAVDMLPMYRELWGKIRSIEKPLSVAKLVAREQRRYWNEHPESYSDFCRESSKERARWRHMTDPEYRLYNRQKSKRRKAQLRGSIGIHVKPKELRARFAEFEDCCAYCGASNQDLHIEHVIPISKGGTHVLGNIVPACKSCNFSKTDHDAETWYRAQPFFSEKRWKRILKVLGLNKGSPAQLALL